jgi:hypothetical protein
MIGWYWRHFLHLLLLGAGSCDVVLQDVDLFGGDIGGGTVVSGSSLTDCCAACRREASCGAFTYVPSAGICYLKYGSGWTRKANSGLQSVVVNSAAVASPPLPSGSGNTPSPSPSSGGTYQFVPMTQDQMRRMYQLTSVFENANVSMGRESW